MTLSVTDKRSLQQWVALINLPPSAVASIFFPRSDWSHRSYAQLLCGPRFIAHLVRSAEVISSIDRFDLHFNVIERNIIYSHVINNNQCVGFWIVFWLRILVCWSNINHTSNRERIIITGHCLSHTKSRDQNHLVMLKSRQYFLVKTDIHFTCISQ